MEVGITELSPIRNAISLGGDSDTLAAITGSIAEAAYNIPQEIKRKVLDILEEPLINIYRKYSERVDLLEKL